MTGIKCPKEFYYICCRWKLTKLITKILTWEVSYLKTNRNEISLLFEVTLSLMKFQRKMFVRNFVNGHPGL